MKQGARKCRALFLLAGVLGVARVAGGWTDNFWMGTDGDWSHPSNWSLNAVPTEDHRVVFEDGRGASFGAITLPAGDIAMADSPGGWLFTTASAVQILGSGILDIPGDNPKFDHRSGKDGRDRYAEPDLHGRCVARRVFPGRIPVLGGFEFDVDGHPFRITYGDNPGVSLTYIPEPGTLLLLAGGGLLLALRRRGGKMCHTDRRRT